MCTDQARDCEVGLVPRCACHQSVHARALCVYVCTSVFWACVWV